MRNKKGRKVRSGFGKALILLHNYNQRNCFLKGTPGASYLSKGISVWLRKRESIYVFVCRISFPDCSNIRLYKV